MVPLDIRYPGLAGDSNGIRLSASNVRVRSSAIQERCMVAWFYLDDSEYDSINAT